MDRNEIVPYVMSTMAMLPKTRASIITLIKEQMMEMIASMRSSVKTWIRISKLFRMYTKVAKFVRQPKEDRDIVIIVLKDFIANVLTFHLHIKDIVRSNHKTLILVITCSPQLGMVVSLLVKQKFLTPENCNCKPVISNFYFLSIVGKEQR